MVDLESDTTGNGASKLVVTVLSAAGADRTRNCCVLHAIVIATLRLVDELRRGGA